MARHATNGHVEEDVRSRLLLIAMTPPTRWRAVLRAWILVLLLGMATGCRVGLDLGIDIDRDGGGSLTLGMRADAAALDRAEAVGSDPLAPLVQAGEQLRGEGWTLRDWTDDLGSREVQLTTRFADPAELEVLAGDLAEALAAPEGRPLESLAVSVTEDRVRVEGVVGLQPTEEVADYGLSAEQAVDLLRERNAIDYRVRVAMPGEILEHNGTLIEDTAMQWQVLPGERVDFQVESVRPTGPDWLLLGLGAAIAVSALVLIVLLLRQRRGRAGHPRGGARRPPRSRHGRAARLVGFRS